MFPSSDDDGKISSKLKTSASSSIQVHRWWKLRFTLKTLFLWLACLQLGCNRPVRPNVQFNETLKTHSASLGLVQLFRRYCSYRSFLHFCEHQAACELPRSTICQIFIFTLLPSSHCMPPTFVNIWCSTTFSLCFYVTVVVGQSGTSLVARGTGTTEGRMAPQGGGTTPGHTAHRLQRAQHPDPPALCVRRHLEPATFPSFHQQ